MKVVTSDLFNATEVAEELLKGSGAVRFPKLFSAAQVSAAKQFIDAETKDFIETGSHFNQSDNDARLQRRIWNLAPKSPTFVEMLEHPQVIESMKAFLGSDFVLGSYCASRTMPGFGGQDPHIDYPYWDFYRAHSFPAGLNSSFPLNAQAMFIIDPFTLENGATAFWPGSYKELSYPKRTEKLMSECIRMVADPGDVILFFGAAWHCAMPNNSDSGRIGLLIEFLPKFVKPIEDMLTNTDPDWIAKASPIMRQMLGFDYPWPSTPPAPPKQ